MANDGQPEDRHDKSKIILVGVILIILAIVVITVFTGGFQSLQALLGAVIQYTLIAAIVGLIIWVVLKILQKPKIDLVALDKQNIIDAAILSKPPMVKDLYFTGDKEHGEFRVGAIIGYCQIQSYKELEKISSLTPEKIAEMQKEGREPSEFIIKEDCFVFKKMGFPFNIFEQPKVLRTLEDEHSQLIGDVKIYGVSMHKKFEYYWPNRSHLDVARIDHSVIKEAWRGSVHQFLKDQVSIQQRAVGLDSEHRKNMENRKLLKIPGPLGEESSRQGGN